MKELHWQICPKCGIPIKHLKQHLRKHRLKKEIDTNVKPYCTHPIHTIRTKGKPIKLSINKYLEKDCIGRNCKYLYLDKEKHDNEMVL